MKGLVHRDGNEKAPTFEILDLFSGGADYEPEEKKRPG